MVLRSTAQCPQYRVTNKDKSCGDLLPPSGKYTVGEVPNITGNWLVEQQTELMTQTTIIAWLKAWRMGETPTHLVLGYTKHSQDQLGWNLALEGVLMTQWRIQQDHYWQHIKSCQSAKWWTAELIKNVEYSMGCHGNTEIMLHKTANGRLLIVEGDVNKQVILTYITWAHNMLAGNLPLIWILLDKLITGNSNA